MVGNRRGVVTKNYCDDVKYAQVVEEQIGGQLKLIGAEVVGGRIGDPQSWRGDRRGSSHLDALCSKRLVSQESLLVEHVKFQAVGF